jgi:phosphatidylglycerophosphate synthase
VLDAEFRPLKSRLLAPVAARLGTLPPLVLTAGGLALGLLAAATVVWGAPRVAVVWWLASRLLDGLDGELARSRKVQSDLGGYFDLLADFVVYAAIPLALAWHGGDLAGWIAAAVLVSAFYVNSASWMYLAAVLEKRRSATGTTLIAMPAGLVEGGETIVLFAGMLLVPGAFPVLALAMAALVVLTVLQRIRWAVRRL